MDREQPNRVLNIQITFCTCAVGEGYRLLEVGPDETHPDHETLIEGVRGQDIQTFLSPRANGQINGVKISQFAEMDFTQPVGGSTPPLAKRLHEIVSERVQMAQTLRPETPLYVSVILNGTHVNATRLISMDRKL